MLMFTSDQELLEYIKEVSNVVTTHFLCVRLNEITYTSL